MDLFIKNTNQEIYQGIKSTKVEGLFEIFDWMLKSKNVVNENSKKKIKLIQKYFLKFDFLMKCQNIKKELRNNVIFIKNEFILSPTKESLRSLVEALEGVLEKISTTCGDGLILRYLKVSSLATKIRKFQNVYKYKLEKVQLEKIDKKFII